ncbi:Uncharacterized protein SCG7109_AB_00090 [Chlamydiales bacterium SCGC AG-110-M15]|nr:Uncharacterized protein SCG7109_AB_00090 [Chlamydiales bacterium SCGC AG-110-M15]
MEAFNDITADAKGRISLGVKHAGERYIITKGDAGKFILERAVLIPERELWLYQNKGAGQVVQEGLKQAKQGKTKTNAVNLDEYNDI